MKTKKKVHVTDTAALDAGEGRRVAVRRYNNGMRTVEVDIETLAEVGLPVTISGERRRGTWQADVESGPTWRQK